MVLAAKMAEETGDLDAILDNALDQFVDELDEEQGDVNATVSKAAKDTALQSTEDDKKSAQHKVTMLLLRAWPT